MIGRRALRGLITLAAHKPQVTIAAPSLTHPISQACAASQFEEPAYAYWCEKIREAPRLHRKQWEFCYILQVLATHGMLAPGRKGLGFGVGEEPLAAVMAAHGVEVLATDLEPERAEQLGWVQTQQHAANLDALNNRGICLPKQFARNVRFSNADMNNIPANFKGFDFCWSACAMEHLGSIEQGLAFVTNASLCLKPGGLAVHTTEFNCSSNSDTLSTGATVLFRRRDLSHLANLVAKQKNSMALTFELGNKPLDRHIDIPPYSPNNHLKIQLDQWSTTSFGVAIKKLG